MKLKKNIIREIFPHLKLKDKNISWFKYIYLYKYIGTIMDYINNKFTFFVTIHCKRYLYLSKC